MFQFMYIVNYTFIVSKQGGKPRQPITEMWTTLAIFTSKKKKENKAEQL